MVEPKRCQLYPPWLNMPCMIFVLFSLYRHTIITQLWALQDNGIALMFISALKWLYQNQCLTFYKETEPYVEVNTFFFLLQSPLQKYYASKQMHINYQRALMRFLLLSLFLFKPSEFNLPQEVDEKKLVFMSRRVVLTTKQRFLVWVYMASSDLHCKCENHLIALWLKAYKWQK